MYLVLFEYTQQKVKYIASIFVMATPTCNVKQFTEKTLLFRHGIKIKISGVIQVVNYANV